MLKTVEGFGESDIVTFLPHGRAFIVRDVDQFVSTILPMYFKHSTWGSFTRQLSLYGFRRLLTGLDVGAYYNELFLRGHKEMCLHMRRVGVPKKDCDRRSSNSKATKFDQEPDFYTMKPLP
jgi:hypothetical protein